MTKVLSAGAPLPVPRSNDPAVLQQYLTIQARNLRDNFVTIAERVNDEVLVRTDWIRPLNSDYLILPSDRVLLFYPTADRTATLPLTADMDEPHPITIRHAGGANTVTVVATLPEFVNPTPIALTTGLAVTLVALNQTVVDSTGLGVVEWVVISGP